MVQPPEDIDGHGGELTVAERWPNFDGHTRARYKTAEDHSQCIARKPMRSAIVSFSLVPDALPVLTLPYTQRGIIFLQLIGLAHATELVDGGSSRQKEVLATTEMAENVMES
jgi:hypothetical protein